MSNRELPMMPWYPDQFEASTVDWSFAEASLYRRLLDAQWQLGSIPALPDRLARICKLTLDEFEPLWHVVSPKFAKARGGRLINKRLEYHRKKAMERKEQYVKAGSAGGQASVQAKRKRRLSNASSDAQARGQRIAKPPSPSPLLREDPTLPSPATGEGLAPNGGTPRETGTNPRALGTNPRANGTNPRTVKQQSQVAWDLVLSAAQKGESTVDAGDIDEAVRLIGGFTKISQARVADRSKNRALFRQTFESILQHKAHP